MLANREIAPAELSAMLRQRLDNQQLHALRHARRRIFSPSLSYGRHFGPPLPTARAAAVMIVLEPRPNGWMIPLTVRPAHLPDHPGQICLPGGRLEDGETAQAAAEREFCEELGLTRFPAETLGALESLYVYNSDFYLTPFLAVTAAPLDYAPCADEVQAVLHLPLGCLVDQQYRCTEPRSRGSVCWNSPGIALDGHHVWGATAIVLGELAALLEPAVTSTAAGIR
jgi:8-oxo-dGTP pyrophosphatase MutT (NUDIX family)